MISFEIQLKSNLEVKQIELDVPCGYHALFHIHKDGFCQFVTPLYFPNFFVYNYPCIWVSSMVLGSLFFQIGHHIKCTL
jgi:hypothetical protein